MPVDRCTCTDYTFEELLDRARRLGLTLDQLADRTGATRHCEMCEPYIREALATGRTVFEVKAQGGGCGSSNEDDTA